MSSIDYTLDYLRESLANYIDNDMCQQIYGKLDQYKNEGEFVRDLDEEEIAYLNDVVKKELDYAKNVQNDVRVQELTEVYELLL
ncbi:sporulation protein [Virgibacillus byunsanensis]|uniref:Sporulation protein n=1 Tax=Virgibacillus byunsanensis TaxID=570945 RepID=A0ABW3LSL9_9BACI